MGTYRVAEICVNGHVVTDSVDSSPELHQDFCSRCGAETATACPDCGSSIRGYYYVEGVVSPLREFALPRFCHACGKPYPWIQTKLDAANELVEELDDLGDDDRAILKKSLLELVQDSPKTEVAALRVKKTLRKAGAAGVETFRSILVDVLSETAKKALGL